MEEPSIDELNLRIREEFARLNAERFGGELGEHSLRFSPNQVRTHGCINFRLRKITISLPMYEQHGWDAVVDTLLHEMTHALLHQRGSHDRHTKLFYRELIARGGTRQKKDVKPRKAYVYACPTCGREFERMRKLKRPWARSCAACDHRYNPRHRLYLKRDRSQDVL
ncbi:MAG: SprT-like domain-containing protein [Candidatus Altiarchaeota archaeon]